MSPLKGSTEGWGLETRMGRVVTSLGQDTALRRVTGPRNAGEPHWRGQGRWEAHLSGAGRASGENLSNYPGSVWEAGVVMEPGRRAQR